MPVFGVFLANHILDAIGLLTIIASAVKITKGYPISRWFF